MVESHGPNFCSRRYESVLTILEMPGFTLLTEEIREKVIRKQAASPLCW